MFDPSFRQQGSFLQRLLAWLVLGVMLLVGAFFLLFALVLSWVLIPILLFRYRQRLRRFREQAQQAQQHGEQHTRSQQGASSGYIIEGEVIHKDDAERR